MKFTGNLTDLMDWKKRGSENDFRTWQVSSYGKFIRCQLSWRLDNGSSAWLDRFDVSWSAAIAGALFQFEKYRRGETWEKDNRPKKEDMY